MLDETQIETKSKASLIDYYSQQIDSVITEVENDSDTAVDSTGNGEKQKKQDVILAYGINEGKITNVNELQKEKSSSILDWLKGLLADLGLGFGWAAAYFTVSVAQTNGSTVGKWVLGIKALQLSGKPFSLWSAFGLYGGYGAGLATGLLGFLQIYWDPNRQAIQDKVAGTVVVQSR